MTFTDSLDAAITLAAAVKPWFDNPNAVGAWLGSSVGVFGGIYGTLAGTLAPRGVARRFIFSLHWLGAILGLAMAVAGIVALSTGQPYAIWYGLGLPGLILMGVLLPLTGVLRQRYREADQRRIDAESFRRA